MSVKLQTEGNLVFLSLKGGCTGWSESTLVKMQHCWKSHVKAHLFIFEYGLAYPFNVLPPPLMWITVFKTSSYLKMVFLP